MQNLGQLPAIINHLCAAGPKGGADPGPDIRVPGFKMILHMVNGPGNDIGSTAPPAIMDGSHHLPAMIVKKNSLAVSLLDHQPNPGHICYKGVKTIQLKISFRFLANHMDSRAMDLAGRNQHLGSKVFFYQESIFPNRCRVISDPEADI